MCLEKQFEFVVDAAYVDEQTLSKMTLEETYIYIDSLLELHGWITEKDPRAQAPTGLSIWYDGPLDYAVEEQRKKWHFNFEAAKVRKSILEHHV